MTITTTDPRMIRKATEAAGLTIKTLRPIVDNDWMVELDEAGADRAAVMTFCRALIAADPSAVILVGKIRVDAAKLASM